MVANLVHEVPISYFSDFLVGYELRTYTRALPCRSKSSSNAQTRFEHLLGLIETKFVALAHLVATLDHELLFKFFVENFGRL